MATRNDRKHSGVIATTAFGEELAEHGVGDEEHVVVERRTAQTGLAVHVGRLRKT